MNGVTIIYGNDPYTMMPGLLEDSRALEAVKSGDRVMIKPNLVVSRSPWAGVLTDPRVVEALIISLKDRGVHRITVGDGSGMGSSAAKALKICGYPELARRYDLKLVDLETDRYIEKKVSVDGPFTHLKIAASVVECDFFINVPLMKAHMITRMTCSLKNLKGTMPRALKTRFHGVNLHQAISQLASVVHPDLNVVDGLKGDLTSESGGTPVQMDRLLVGQNPVEVDSVVADMLGYAPRDIRHIAYSADAGLGTCKLDEIRVRALNRPKKNEKFEPPPLISSRFPCRIHADGACCTCMGNFIFALERLKEKGMLTRDQHFLIGQKTGAKHTDAGMTVSVGQCAVKKCPADIQIDACPPSAGDIFESVASSLKP